MNEKKCRILDDEFVELCAKGNIAEVRAAIADGADVNARSEWGWTALMVAGNKNRTDIVRLLLDSGADVNLKMSDGWTALMSIADKEEVDIEIIKMYLEAGADVNAKNDYGTTPLLRATCQNHRLDIVRLLLDAGADMYARGAIGFDDWEHGGETPVEASACQQSTDMLSGDMIN